MLPGSAHTRSTAAESCACAASSMQASTTPVSSSTGRPARCALLEWIEVAGLDRAIGAALQVGVQAFPVLHDHLARAERRHSLVGPPVDHERVEIILRQGLEA